LPAIGEIVTGFEASGIFGLAAPKGTPKDIIDLLNKEVNAGLKDPKLKERLIELGGIPFPTTPEEFGKIIVEETEKWAKVVKFSGASVD
jgi:tripartite-type tricarboxylate transporter receptor subunit TctC